MGAIGQRLSLHWRSGKIYSAGTMAVAANLLLASLFGSFPLDAVQAIVGSGEPAAPAAETVPPSEAPAPASEAASTAPAASPQAEQAQPNPPAAAAPVEESPQPAAENAAPAPGPAESAEANGAEGPEDTKAEPKFEVVGEETEGVNFDEAEEEEDASASEHGEMAAHGLGIQTGLSTIPSGIFSSFLASHTNALCRGSALGDSAAQNGVTRMEGCNYSVGGEYIFRKSRVLDIVAGAGYQQLKFPDGYWLDKSEWGANCKTHDAACNLAAADYTEIDLSYIYVQADFIARWSLVRTADVDFQLGVGGGVGVGIVVGSGVYQTPLGQGTDGPGPSCTRLEDLRDFSRCTPQYFDDPDIDQNGDGDNSDGPRPPKDGFHDPSGGPPYYAECSSTDCSEADLNSFGTRVKNSDVPPVLPIATLVGTVRIIVRDTLGINIMGGFKNGIYFGGGLQYFFGKGM